MDIEEMSISEGHSRAIFGFSLAVNLINLIVSGGLYSLLGTLTSNHHGQLNLALARFNTSLNFLGSLSIISQLLVFIGYGTEQIIDLTWFCPVFRTFENFFLSFAQFIVVVLIYDRFRKLEDNEEEQNTKRILGAILVTGLSLFLFYTIYNVTHQFKLDITGNFCIYTGSDDGFYASFVVTCVYQLMIVISWLMSSKYLHLCTKLDITHPYHTTRSIYLSNVITYFITYCTPSLFFLVKATTGLDGYHHSLYFTLFYSINALLGLLIPLFLIFTYKELRILLIQIVQCKGVSSPSGTRDSPDRSRLTTYSNDSNFSYQL